MIHARPDYARVQDPWKKIGDDEPVFLIRAKDILFPTPLLAYLEAYSAQEGADQVIIDQLYAHLNLAVNWRARNAHLLKVADAPKEDCGCEPSS